MQPIKFLCACFCLLSYTFSGSTTIRIPDDYSSIQQGIQASNNNDTILVAAGTYQENLDFLGKNILVVSESGPSSTSIFPQASGQSIVAFVSNEARQAILSGFTIRDSENAPALLIRGSSPSVIDNRLLNNSHSSYGGAISADEGSFPLIQNNYFINNSASRGGGVDSGMNGSGNIIVEGNIFIADSSSTHGGALFIGNASSSSSVHRNIFYQNNCPELGGGMCISVSSGVSIFNNSFYENSSNQEHHGAGITIWYSSGCLIFNNIVAKNAGEGIFQAYGSSNEAFYNDCWENDVDYEGFSPGPGSISEDPLFIGGNPFDFHLRESSPCIDAGDPDSPLDPDGSIADMGAYYYGSVITAAVDIADTYGENGQPVDIPLAITGLSENPVAGLEFHVAYDPACIEYTSFSSDYLADPLVNVADGVINILWEDFENPVTIPDSASAISLQFAVLGELGNVCELSWSDNNELVDPLGEVIQGVTWIDGSVTIIEFHSVSGNVVYYDLLTPVPGVTVQLSGDYSQSAVTDDTGAYIFETLFPGSFTLCPSRIEDDQGVTVTDIVSIRRHIVRLEPFDTPYKLAAADVNVSGGVSVADVIKLRRYLAELENLPGGNWTFIDSSYVIDMDNWAAAPGCIDFDLWDSDLTDSSFVGIRLGDVDYSWTGDRRRIPPPKPQGNIELDLEDCQGIPGDIVRMPIIVSGFEDIAGFELHLEFDSNALNCLGFESEFMNEPTVNISADKAHFVWEDIFNPATIDDGHTLLFLDIEILDGAADTAVVAVATSHSTDLNGVDCVVFASDGLIFLQYPTENTESGALPEFFALREIYPNPFNAATNIGFELPDASNVNLTVYDLLGREIGILTDRLYPAGYHCITWDAGDQPSGIYFVRLRADQFIAERKTLLLK